MSKYSLNWKGKVIDFGWRKQYVGDMIVYVFHLEGVYVGQIFRKGKGSYSVVGKTPNKLCPIENINSRIAASELLLKLEGYT